MSKHAKGRARKPIGYAVVGLGHIAQVAVLPAFAHAKRNSRLVALVSDDRRKRSELGRRFGVETYTYDEYDECLSNPEVDAVYIALPNSLHCNYTVRAARNGVHVLCEKPMALDERQCLRMIRAAKEYGVKLMIAYRLHFEEANLLATQVVRRGKLGKPRIFNSVFGMQVNPGDIRLKRELGGGTLYDIGIYCINAARALFRDEPVEVAAFTSSNGDQRFREVDEMTSALLRFPGDRLASFTSSFGAADVATYDVIGTQGRLRVEPAYEYAEGLSHHLMVNGKERRRYFPKRDQFAAELLYFSDCIRRGREPEPSGYEGLADIRIIRALQRSAATQRPVKLAPLRRKLTRPSVRQEIRRPPVRKPRTVRARPPSQ
jgi:glucose-fructose oxidoreductase